MYLRYPSKIPLGPISGMYYLSRLQNQLGSGTSSIKAEFGEKDNVPASLRLVYSPYRDIVDNGTA
jgi:hypothetical protein